MYFIKKEYLIMMPDDRMVLTKDEQILLKHDNLPYPSF